MNAVATLNLPTNKEGSTAPEPLADYGELLSANEVCELTGLSGRVVRAYLAAGKLPGVKIGARWIVPKQKLIEYLGM